MCEWRPCSRGISRASGVSFDRAVQLTLTEGGGLVGLIHHRLARLAGLVEVPL